MDDRAAGEIEGAQVAEPPALAPDPMGYRRVNQQSPQQRKQNESLEALAFRERTGDQGRRDDREHHLEGHVGGARDGRRVLG